MKMKNYNVVIPDAFDDYAITLLGNDDEEFPTWAVIDLEQFFSTDRFNCFAYDKYCTFAEDENGRFLFRHVFSTITTIDQVDMTTQEKRRFTVEFYQKISVSDKLYKRLYPNGLPTDDAVDEWRFKLKKSNITSKKLFKNAPIMISYDANDFWFDFD